ncbi:MAG: phosphoribosylglycinamide formyltransferase [Phycisphaera sp.]|nr:MAG: phosphoribosylglycinamide formyltransferase [Phycisphaera sp.]
MGDQREAPRLLALLSGGGRTLLNLLDAIEAGALHARVAGVVASRPCAGAERAEARGLQTEIIRGMIPAQELLGLVRAHGASWVVLCGYLQRIDVPDELAGRIVNIHPALLPKFGGPGMYGDRVHRAVLDAGETESGCTVHVCDAEYDTGPIVLQERCPVLPGDTVDSLAARVFELECRAYPKALTELLSRDGAAQEATR